MLDTICSQAARTDIQGTNRTAVASLPGTGRVGKDIRPGQGRNSHLERASTGEATGCEYRTRSACSVCQARSARLLEMPSMGVERVRPPIINEIHKPAGAASTHYCLLSAHADSGRPAERDFGSQHLRTVTFSGVTSTHSSQHLSSSYYHVVVRPPLWTRTVGTRRNRLLEGAWKTRTGLPTTSLRSGS